MAIHNKNYKIPIIVLSGSDSRDLAAEILRKGGQDVISKSKIARQSFSEAILNSIQRNKFILESKELLTA